MFTPVEASVGALLIHLAVSTLLLNNGDILDLAAIFNRDTDMWKGVENLGVLAGLAATGFAVDAFTPTLSPAFVSDSDMTSVAGLGAAGAGVGWGTRNVNGCVLVHAFCGIPILSRRSIIAALLICVTTFIAVNVVALDTTQLPEADGLFIIYPSRGEMEVLMLITTIAFLTSLLLHYAFRTTRYIRIVVGFVSGIEFGLGLIVSGLATPGKVLALFCLRDGSRFDPSLVLLIPFGILPTLIRVWLRGFNKAPKFDREFHLSALTVSEMSWRFYLGSIVLGLGWSWTGLCLGPAILRAVLDPSWGCYWGGGFAAGYVLLP